MMTFHCFLSISSQKVGFHFVSNNYATQTYIFSTYLDDSSHLLWCSSSSSSSSSSCSTLFASFASSTSSSSLSSASSSVSSSPLQSSFCQLKEKQGAFRSSSLQHVRYTTMYSTLQNKYLHEPAYPVGCNRALQSMISSPPRNNKCKPQTHFSTSPLLLFSTRLFC